MKSYSLFFSFIFSTFSFAQVQYYVFEGQKVLTEVEKSDYILKSEKMYSESMKTKLKAAIKIRYIEKKGDSIINYVSIALSDERLNMDMNPLNDFFNKQLPESKLETLDKKPFLLSDLNGKPTLINFWFTSCTPCIKEIPMLNQLYHQYKDKFNFIAITFDSQNSVERFIKKNHFKFTHVVNAKDFITELGFKGYPLNVFLDKEGKVKYVDRNIQYFNLNSPNKTQVQIDFIKKMESLE